MSHSLLSTLKPLVFEGKTGVFEVTHISSAQAYFYLREGLIEQVTTQNLQGSKAVKTCLGWVNISTTFFEDEPGNYTPDAEIETATILSYLEKVSKNIGVIQKKIPDIGIVLEIDSSKLSTTDTLTTKDLKIALLFDGKRSVEQIVAGADTSELVILTHTCRLIMAGIAKKAAAKESMMEEEQNFFLHSLTETLTNLVGLAGPLLMNDAFVEIQSKPGLLSKEDIPLLLGAIGKMLDPDEKRELDEWGTAYLAGI